MRDHSPIGTPVLPPERHVPSFVLATMQRARPHLCICQRTSDCTNDAGRASDGSHCRDHLTPRLEDDAR